MNFIRNVGDLSAFSIGLLGGSNNSYVTKAPCASYYVPIQGYIKANNM